MKERNYFLLFLLIGVLFLIIPIMSADIISQNSGGTGNVIINPGSWIENFFFGEPDVGPICGNSVIETGETCDDGNVVAGDGCSATCQIETADGGGSGGGSGGGGGGTTPTVPTIAITVVPDSFNINLALNTNVEKTITVTNNEASAINLSVSEQGLGDKVLLSTDRLEIEPGRSKIIDAVFIALSQTGVFTGSIAIGGEEVLVTLNIRTVLLLFDSNIVVLNKDYLVPQGDDLKTMVKLIPMGEKERMDVTLNYVIKDYKDVIYLTKSETLLIENQIEFQRNFDTGSLPLGKYVIGLELIYPNGLAPSSAHFEVTEAPPIDIFSILVWILIILILIILIVIVIIQIKKQRDKQKAGGTFKPPIFPVGTIKPKAPPTVSAVKPKIIPASTIPVKPKAPPVVTV